MQSLGFKHMDPGFRVFDFMPGVIHPMDFLALNKMEFLEAMIFSGNCHGPSEQHWAKNKLWTYNLSILVRTTLGKYMYYERVCYVNPP